jgi:hypothetical protein
MKGIAMSGLTLLITDASGIYIPKEFCNRFAPESWGLSEDMAEWHICSMGPDTEWYWESWDEIVSRASHKDANGHIWSLHQDGDVWAVCVELMTDEEYEYYFGESRQAA